LTAKDRKAVEQNLLKGFQNDGMAPDPRATICHLFHLLEPDLAVVYECSDLVYKAQTRKRT
ncbi:MAG: hypothetical protein Q7J80_06215, partial [Anaerolineales bacterium]|nr:hypothetical protein [Anaerolineales bacterium]